MTCPQASADPHGIVGAARYSAAHRVIDTVGLLPALAPVRQRRIDQVTIVDGTRLVIAAGDPQPGNRNDGTVCHESGIAYLRNIAIIG